MSDLNHVLSQEILDDIEAPKPYKGRDWSLTIQHSNDIDMDELNETEFLSINEGWNLPDDYETINQIVEGNIFMSESDEEQEDGKIENENKKKNNEKENLRPFNEEMEQEEVNAYFEGQNQNSHPPILHDCTDVQTYDDPEKYEQVAFQNEANEPPKKKKKSE